MAGAFVCEAVVFDLDGVLVDSGDAVVLAWQQLAVEYDFDLAPVFPDLHGVRTVDALPSNLAEQDAAAAEQRLEDIEIAMSTGSQPVAGAKNLLASLPAGRWGIATSGSRALATARLTAVGIEVPAVMITADDVPAGKPNPAPYLAAAAALQVTPGQTLVFEDAPSGAAAARATGATVIGVATTHRPGDFEAVAWIDDLTAIEVAGLDPLVLRIPPSPGGESGAGPWGR